MRSDDLPARPRALRTVDGQTRVRREDRADLRQAARFQLDHVALEPRARHHARGRAVDPCLEADPEMRRALGVRRARPALPGGDPLAAGWPARRPRPNSSPTPPSAVGSSLRSPALRTPRLVMHVGALAPASARSPGRVPSARAACREARVRAGPAAQTERVRHGRPSPARSRRTTRTSNVTLQHQRDTAPGLLLAPLGPRLLESPSPCESLG